MHAKHLAKFANPVLVAALLLSSQLAAAQQVQPGNSQPQRPGALTVDPSAGPLAPAEPSQDQSTDQTTLPSSPELQQAPPPRVQQQASQPAPQQPAASEPLGAAAAGQVKTAGGIASRPAGNAIAPAKQHQYRSLVIKLGALAAAGIAVGTVYGLTHATPSTPPHTATAAAK